MNIANFLKRMVVTILMSNKAIFFDRDGTLNVDVDFLHEVEKFKWVDGAIETIKFCNDNGYLAIVITNQSGVARGFYTEDDVNKIHQYMNDELAKINAHIDAFYYCPHHINGIVEKYKIDCDCRKPKTKMIEDACAKFNINRNQSFMIGDMKRDVECGENAGIRGILFEGNNLFDCLMKALR